MLGRLSEEDPEPDHFGGEEGPVLSSLTCESSEFLESKVGFLLKTFLDDFDLNSG